MDQRTRNLVFERAGGICEYCCTPTEFSTDDFAVEHIIPKSRGGTDDVENLAWSCQGCNSRKFIAVSASDPVTGTTALLFHPRTDRWEHHFQWSSDGTRLIGRSPTGRATIARLDLNRLGAINIRRAMIALGEHPMNAQADS